MRRLVLLAVAVAAVVAWAAPSAFAQTTISVSGTGAGAVSVAGFNLNCTIVNSVQQPLCTTGATIGDGSLYIITVTAAPNTTVIALNGCPTPAAINPAGGVCAFTTPPGGGPVSVTVVMQPKASTLVVQKSGTGTATVTSSPGGISCGSSCLASFPNNSVVTLTVSLGAGTTFNGWGGACTPAGRNPTCVLAMTSNNIVSISTSLVTFPLTVTTAGNGTGTVTSTPSGIVCPATCAAAVVAGTTVSLSANPSAGSVFGGFSGACTGKNCTITVTGAANVTATFAPEAVEAAVVGNKIRKTGPPRARRILSVTIDADEEVRIVLRIQRGGVTLQTRRVRSFGPETGVVRFPIRNGIAAGRARLLVTMTSEDGVAKTQTRRLRIPAVS